MSKPFRYFVSVIVPFFRYFIRFLCPINSVKRGHVHWLTVEFPLSIINHYDDDDEDHCWKCNFPTSLFSMSVCTHTVRVSVCTLKYSRSSSLQPQRISWSNASACVALGVLHHYNLDVAIFILSDCFALPFRLLLHWIFNDMFCQLRHYYIVSFLQFIFDIHFDKVITIN